MPLGTQQECLGETAAEKGLDGYMAKKIEKKND